MEANELKAYCVEALKEIFGLLENAGDPKLTVAKSHVRNAIGAISPKETVGLRGLNANVNNIPKTTFGTTPPKRKGSGGQNTQTGAPAAEDKEIVLNENTTFKVGTPANKKKGKAFVEASQEKTAEEIAAEEALKQALAAAEEEETEEEVKKITFSIEQMSKIAAHPNGGIMKKLVDSTAEEILELYSFEQLKAIAVQIGADIHPAMRRADSVLAKILDRINFITTAEFK
jgi:hypothetical protein